MPAHLADDVVSALIDDRLAAAEQAAAEAHLGTCAACQRRVEELRSVVSMLRALPRVEPPRSFVLGPRRLEEAPNVVRLRRWYVATRIAAGSLAAVFVLLSASALYVDSRPANPGQVLSSASAGEAATSRDAAKPSAPLIAPAAAPAAPTSAAPPGLAVRSAPAPNAAAGAEPADQIAAATSVRPLPTPPPTPLPAVAPTPVPAVARPAAAAPVRDAAAPFRFGALALGLLTVLALLVAILVRHRLRQAAFRI